jgi:hypothetical protein
MYWFKVAYFASCLQKYLKIKLIFKKACKLFFYLIKFDCQSIFLRRSGFEFSVSK